MSKIFIHIINDTFIIDDFFCKFTEVKELFTFPTINEKYYEIQFNEDSTQGNYMKFDSTQGVHIEKLPTNILKFFKDFIKNKTQYIAQIQESITQKLLQNESERLALELSSINKAEPVIIE